MLLALGVVGWWRLASINARYSRVLTEATVSLNELQEVGLHAFASYGHIIELQKTQDPAARAKLTRTIADERAANDRLYAQLKSTLKDPDLRACLEEVLNKRAICRKQADAFTAGTPDPKSTAANDDGSVDLLHSFLSYQTACDRLTDRIETVSLESSRDLTHEITNLRWLFLGVGILPLASGLILLVVLLGLLKVITIHGDED
jgi:hypothetical protein